MLSPGHDPVRALRERATQNALAGLGYPVPRVLIASADRGPLGAGFLVMERAAGRPLLATRRPGIGRTLAEAHARLHALNAEALLRALDDEGRAAGWGFDRDAVGFESHLASLDRRIQAAGLAGLADGMRWLRTRQPAERSARVICHGDFHPQNLLAEDGRVTAVLDWPNALVAAPEYDVAATRVILTQTPIALLPMPAALRPLAAAAAPAPGRALPGGLPQAAPARSDAAAVLRGGGVHARAGARRGGARGGGRGAEPARRLVVRRAPRRALRARQRGAGDAAAAPRLTVLPFPRK